VIPVYIIWALLVIIGGLATFRSKVKVTVTRNSKMVSGIELKNAYALDHRYIDYDRWQMTLFGFQVTRSKVKSQ